MRVDATELGRGDVRARRSDVAVVMPAYNEAEGIAEFVREIGEAFAELALLVIVVDDASTDGTAEALRAVGSTQVRIVENQGNRGHGASTLRALAEGFAANAPIVIAVDGDGQFLGTDLARVFRAVGEHGVDVVEGVRQARRDPWYRRLVALVARLLVWERAGSRPGDANTPLRAYRRAALGRLLDDADPAWLTPNLQFSVAVRRGGLRVVELPVASLPRRGAVQVGTMWGSSRRALPSWRFLRFSALAAAQWRTARAQDRRGGHGGERT